MYVYYVSPQNTSPSEYSQQSTSFKCLEANLRLSKIGFRPVSRLFKNWSLNWVLVVMSVKYQINQDVQMWCNDLNLTFMQFNEQ